MFFKNLHGWRGLIKLQGHTSLIYTLLLSAQSTPELMVLFSYKSCISVWLQHKIIISWKKLLRAWPEWPEGFLQPCLRTVNVEIYVGGLIFVGKFTHETKTYKNLYTWRINSSNYCGPVVPTKVNPHKFNPRNIVSTKICTFTVLYTNWAMYMV